MEETQTLVSSLEEEKLFLLESGLKNVKPQTASVLLSRHVEEGRAERIRESENGAGAHAQTIPEVSGFYW